MVQAKVNELLITPKFANQSDYLKVWQNANNKVAETLKKKIGAAIGTAVGSGFSIQAADRYGKRLTEQASKLFDLQEAHNARVAKAEQELQSGLLSDKHKEELRQQILLGQKEISSLENKFKREMKQAEEIGEAIAESATKSLGERSEEAAAGFADAFQDVLSKDIGRLGERFKKIGQGAAVAGAKTGDTGIGKLLGPILGKLGTAIKLFGTLVASFGSYFTMLVEADAALKQFNNEIVRSGAVLGDFVDGVEGVEDAFDNLRNAFTEIDGLKLNYLYGMTAKENAAVLGQFMAAGQTYKKITAEASNATEAKKKLLEATETTLIYSRLFGEEAGAMSEKVSDYMESLGYSIETVAESLSLVHQQAMQSGFGIKRFFTLLNQATADMSMYNVRLEEAGMLLTKLGKAVGVKAAGAELQNLMKGFGDENIQARIKRLKTTPEMQEIYKRDAEASATQFIRNLGENSQLANTLREALGDLTPANLIEKLAAMSPEQQAKLLADAQMSGNDDLVRSLDLLMKKAGGTTGSLEGMVKGMGTLGPGAKLIARMTQGQNIQGLAGTPLYKMGLEQLMAFENISGIQGEQLEMLIALNKRTEGSFNKLKEVADRGVALSDEEEKLLVEQHGATVRNGKILQAQIVEGQVRASEREVKSANELLMMDAQMEDVLKAGIDQDKALAQESARRLTEITKVIEMGVEALLLQIAGAVDNIWNWLSSKGLDDTEKQNLATLLEKFSEREKALLAEQNALRAKIREKGKLYDEARELGKKDEAATLKSDLDALEKQEQVLAKQRSLVVKARSASREVSGYGKTGSFTPEELQEKIAARLAETEQVSTRDAQAVLAGAAPPDLMERMPTYNAAAARDFLLQVGSNGRVKFAQRVDANDVAVLSKSGGALDQAAKSASATGSIATTGPGGVTNVFHLYNDAPGMVRAIAQAQRAGVL